MSKWQELEKECCDYLNKTYGTEKVVFKITGGSDSNAPDIEVYIDGVNIFNIEVKSSFAQSGQFVVLEVNGSFVFSDKNKSDEEDALPILEYMNANFDKYKNISTAGVGLDMDDDQYVSWVVRHYLSKDEKFVITKQGCNFVLLPTEKYGEYFQTTASYRIKKSGSENVSKSAADELKRYFLSFDSNAIVLFEGKRLIVITSRRMSEKEKFFVGAKEFMVSEVVGGAYYIRKLSNTRNANVIFLIKLKKEQEPSDIAIFEEALK